MNKSDIKLILILAVITLSCFILFNFSSDNKDKKALVYYENKLIKTIDLTSSNTYTVNGYNGKVVLETKQGSIRVREEKSPLHICSKQGWVSNTNEIIVCLPNKIVIKLQSNNEDLDAVVK
jgi:hypothetical protein